MKILDLDSQRPHLTMQASNGSVHVLPASLIDDVISQKRDIADIDDYKDIVSVIFKEWLEDLTSNIGDI